MGPIKDQQVNTTVYIPQRDCYSIDEVVNILSQFNVQKTDIEHWITDGKIWPSVVCNATPAIIVTDDNSYFEFQDGEKDYLASLLPESTDIILNINSEPSAEFERFIKIFNGRMAQIHGLWKISSLLYEDSAFLQPITEKLRFHCLASPLSQLEYVLEYAEVEKILKLIKQHSVRFNPLSEASTPTKTDSKTPNSNVQLELSITTMILAVISLLPSIKHEDFYGGHAKLYKKLKEEFKAQNSELVSFDLDNLNKWIDSEHFELFTKFIQPTSPYQRQNPVIVQNKDLLLFSAENQVLDSPLKKIRKQRVDPKRAKALMSLLPLLPGISPEDIQGCVEKLQPKIYKAFWQKNVIPPFIDVETLSRWKKYGLD